MLGAVNLCVLVLLLTSASASSSSSPSATVVDFVAVDALPDGEMERRVHYHGITAQETYTAGLTLRQVTDGARLLQLIYESDGDGEEVLRDCEVVRRRRVVADFLRGFRRGLERGGNVTLTPLDAAGPSSPALPRWLDFPRLREQCQRRHRQLRALARDSLHRPKRTLLLAPGTRWCGPNGKMATSHQLGPLTVEDRCCRQHDRCTTNIHAFSSAFGFFNFRPFTLSHCRCDHSRRTKRDLLVPGTQWCGKGRSALTYTQLGGFESADKCCRLHDTKCPFYISAFETKYGLFNWRINTIMHCSCDERFRTCLKMAGTGAANLVGKLFFNIVQTKCFVLKPKKVCTSMSYWGKCQKYRYRKQAHLRNNLSY